MSINTSGNFFLLGFSEAEPKGSDCYDQFSTMQECFSRYPTVYNKSGGPEDEDDESVQTITNESLLATSQNPVDTVDQTEESNKQNATESDTKPMDKK